MRRLRGRVQPPRLTGTFLHTAAHRRLTLFDLIIRNGTVIDGTRADRYPADIGLRADRIAAVGDLGNTQSQHSIDAQGKIVAPGFVDVHNHSDGWLLQKPNFLPKTLQGFTTEVLMADGISYAPVDAATRAHWLYYMRALNGLMQSHYQGWESLADYMQLLDGSTAQNTITHLPYAHLRAMACGWDRRVPDDVQMEEILAGVARGMAEGAVGVSTGLDYIAECFATTDELVEACTAMAAQQGLYVTHVRYKKGTLAGVQEAVEIGRRAGVPVHISHFKGTSPQQIDELLSYVDQVAVNEVDFSFDVYPYLPGSTMLNFMLPYEVWEDGPLGVLPKLNDPAVRRRFARALDRYVNPLDRMTIAWLPGRDNARFIGRTLDEYVQQADASPADALCDLLIEENLAVLLVFHHGDDALVHPFLSHDKYMLGSDGIYFPDGAVHPRLYGSAARLLGPCVRDHQLFSLEDAVYKLSAHPASRFGLTQRGQIAEGFYADLVVFDAATVADRATYQDPHQYSVGVEHVLVNGVPIVRNGGAVEDLGPTWPGRYLKFKA